jgi:16S rRNA A1518/A1519 N6-dimethyltransferase RsmA/KsgA/DIM1 with predicted DNA glycosylase/AP lyase activity
VEEGNMDIINYVSSFFTGETKR